MTKKKGRAYMDQTVLSIIIVAVLGVAFIAVVANEIRKKKQGKHSCSCGGNCGACPVGCGRQESTDK